MSVLHSFLSDRGITQSDFAARLHVDQATVSRLVRGVARPSLDLAVRIERETEGLIPASSWVGENAA